MLLISSNVYYRIVFFLFVCYYMFTRLDYSSALEYSIIRRYTNIVYYYDNYRGIALFSCASKLFTAYLNRRLSHYVDANGRSLLDGGPCYEH